MSKIRLTYMSICMLMVTSLSLGQNKETKIADQYFKNLSYVESAKLYKKIATKQQDSISQYVLERLGDSYYYNHELEAASKWYGMLMNNYQNQTDAEYAFKYAQSLRGTGDYAGSDTWMAMFKSKSSSDSRGASFVSNKDKLSDLQKNNGAYQVRNAVKVNTKFSDYGTSYYGDAVLFSSSKKEGGLVKRSYAWNKEPFLDFYTASINEEGFLDNQASFSKAVNSKYHESNAAFTSDGQTMYFTRNNYNEGDYKTSSEGVNNLKLYKATKELQKDSTMVWSNVEELPFNSDEYSVGHPSLSADNKRLYFTSDMPGGKGQTDIYYASINGDNTYGAVTSAGDHVNTEGREMFPFITNDNTLYFSSDGHFGQGGLDIFKSKHSDQGFGAAQALPSPMNSKADDFSLSMHSDNQKGYFSSNRAGGKGGDDIYSFTKGEEIVKEVEEVKCEQVVTGIVQDKKFKKPLPGAKVVLRHQDGRFVSEITAGSQGEFSYTLPCNQNYRVTASKEYYKEDSDTFSTTEAASVELDLDFTLDIIDEFAYNDRNELMIKINPIYFDYNKSNIRPDAARELDYIVSIMNRFPKLVIESTSHTDARGKAAYNRSLSDRRAKSTVRYIISKGIPASRITGNGYGESRLTNKCVDNDRHTNRVKCSKDEHQANRRSEFLIVKM